MEICDGTGINDIFAAIEIEADRGVMGADGDIGGMCGE
jgi:hypothetical protein